MADKEKVVEKPARTGLLSFLRAEMEGIAPPRQVEEGKEIRPPFTGNFDSGCENTRIALREANKEKNTTMVLGV